MYLLEFHIYAFLACCISCSILNSKSFQHDGENTILNSCDVIYGIDLTAPDCEAAISKLPKDIPSDIRPDPETGRLQYPIFSRTTADPRFKLPVSEEVGECRVDVSLVPGKQFDSSLWSLIRLIAKAVNSNCVTRRNGIGGFQRTGEKNWIKVTLYQDSLQHITE